jgi:hypothetical protein
MRRLHYIEVRNEMQHFEIGPSYCFEYLASYSFDIMIDVITITPLLFDC